MCLASIILQSRVCKLMCPYAEYTSAKSYAFIHKRYAEENGIEAEIKTIPLLKKMMGHIVGVA